MSGITDGLGLARESNRSVLSLARREAPRAAGRLPATSQLIAPPCEVVLPNLEKVPTEQRFSVDDREVIALVEILVKSGIAGVKDWEEERKRCESNTCSSLFSDGFATMAERQSNAVSIWISHLATDWSTIRMNEDQRVRST